MNRRAALQMSIQSIITFILAFIVMGALIGVITVIIGQVEEGVTRLPQAELTAQPTRDQPVIVEGGELILRTRETHEIVFGFLNTGDTLVQENPGTCPAGTICNWGGLEFEVTRCTGWDNNAYSQANPDEALLLPAIQAVYEPTTAAETIGNGDVVGLKTFMRENGMAKGEYTCRLAAYALNRDLARIDPISGAALTSALPLASADFVARIR